MSWDEVVTSAVVGTARRPPARPAPPPGSALAGVLGGIEGEDPEGALLQAGAVLGLYRQAGVRLTVDDRPLPAATLPETRPYCSRAAGERLGPILAGPFRPLLGEWLALVRGAGLIVPPDRLPALLQAGSTEPRLRVSIVEVVGERGRWLAGLSPAWGWAVGGGGAEDDTSTWATGSRDARRLLLARLRAADPDRARDLLASSWATETPEDRATFVATLGAGLSMDDEPFLEAALDDRRKEVRHAAAELLWRLPGSRLAARMAARARPLVRITGGGLEASLPDGVDQAMERDGVVARPPAGVGERAWWLHQLLAATPLGTWPEALEEPPSTLVGRAGPPLRQAWAAAAARQADEEWALALLDAGDVDQPALLRAVPPARAQAVAAERVTAEGLTPAVMDLLGQCPAPWDSPLSRVVVDRLGEVAKDRRSRPDAGAVVGLAASLDPSVAPAATVVLAAHASRWSDVVGWFLDLLAFRAEMHEELPLGDHRGMVER